MSAGCYLTDSQTQQTIALLHWGNLIEDFLDSIEVSFEGFCQEMTGGWMFGYIDALKLVGVQTVLFCISAQVNEPTRHTHIPTGAKICVLPAPENYRAIHRHIVNPYGWKVKEMFGDVQGAKYLLSALLKDVSPYLATPLRILVRELQREGCKAILCQEYEYARFDVCVLIGQLLRLPVFATFQGGDFQTSRLERPLRPLTMRACTGLIVATQTEVQRVQSRYGVPNRKIARIFNPLDLSVWDGGDRQKTRATLNISSDALVVVWHGRIDYRRKGLDILLAAWKQICTHCPERDLKLLLVGTGSDAELLRQQIAPSQLQNIIWINRYILERSVIRDYLCAADVYTLPSRHEGFPVAPLEAMACSLPVVAADAPGVADILAGEASGGLIVPREDPEALARSLGQVLDNEEWRRELSRRARERVESAFSLQTVGKQLREFLLEKAKPAEGETV